MPRPEKDELFSSEAIRDTANHDSVSSVSDVFTARTIVVQNGLDQTVDFQLQGSADGTVWLDIDNSAFSVTASTNSYETINDYFFEFRVQAICTVAPTTGSLTLCILKVVV
jgi:hypothetical protein